MQSQSLIKPNNQQIAPVNPMDDWQLMRQQAEVLKSSGFLPSAIKTPEAAMAVILIGRELGLPMMVALNNINVIAGKPTVPPQLMMAMINGTKELEDFKVSDDGKAASCLMKRKGRDSHTETFSMEDADRFLTTEGWGDNKRTINLSEKHNWKSQPRTMRKWRAIAACARVVFPDVIMGLYIPEEMGADVNDDGEVELAMAEVTEKPAAKTPRRALKAVPNPAPVIEAEPIIERGEPLPLRAEQVEALESVEPEANPLPEFAERDSDETAAQIEAERLSLVEELRNLAAEYLALTGNTPDEITAKWETYLSSNDVFNKTRGWLRTKIELTTTNLNKARANVAPVAITNPKDAPAQLPDGRRKVQRTDAEGNSIAVYDGTHMTGRQATHEETIQNLDYWIDYWRTEPRMGQDLATIRAKVARVVGEFHDWSDLNGADLAKAIRVLQEWRPDLDKQTAQKGAKK